jgi:phosphoglycolate phosphatase
MRTVYAGRWAHETKVYAGVPEMLEALRKSGIVCAVCSNKAHDFTVKIIDHFFPGGQFAMVIGGGKFAAKPDPAGPLHIAANTGIAPGEFIYVGDSDVDMRTARNAGMFPLGVAWGFRSREELAANGAEAIIEKPEELFTQIIQVPYV